MGTVAQLRRIADRRDQPEKAERGRLTKRLVEKIVPATNDVFVWDAEVRGFGVRVKPSGVRTYVVQYRNVGGRTRRLALGQHGTLTAEQARSMAQQRLAETKRGEDPSAARQAARRVLSVAQLCDRYMAEHAGPHKRASSVAEDQRLIDKRIKPVLGAMKADAVTSDDVMRVHHALRNTPYEANRTLALLSKVFNLAEAWRVRTGLSNPCRHVKRYPEHKRERFFAVEELGELGRALTELERTRTVRPGALLAIRLLALTGCRRGEILGLRWEHYDASAGLLRLPDSKSGARDVVLARAAVDLLDSAPRPGPYVVQGVREGEPLAAATFEDAWVRVCRSANLTNARLHDLRHTVGTYAGQGGSNAFVVRDMLGHKTLAMTSRYVERDVSPLRVATNEVVEKIAAAMTPGNTKTSASRPD